MADIADLKSVDLLVLRVQVPSPVPAPPYWVEQLKESCEVLLLYFYIYFISSIGKSRRLIIARTRFESLMKYHVSGSSADMINNILNGKPYPTNPAVVVRN